MERARAIFLRESSVYLSNQSEIDSYKSILEAHGENCVLSWVAEDYPEDQKVDHGYVKYNEETGSWVLSLTKEEGHYTLGSFIVFLFNPQLIKSEEDVVIGAMLDDITEDYDITGKMEIMDDYLLDSEDFTQEDREFIMELLNAHTDEWIDYLDNSEV